VQVVTRTEVGLVRQRNEDDCLVDEELRLFVVADGLGGHAAGDVASAVAVRTAHAALSGALSGDPPDGAEPGQELEQAMQAAHRAVLDAAAEDPARAGMGTTMVLAHLSGDERRLWVTHVGDSRAYLFRRGELHRLTADHRTGGVLGNRLSQALGTSGDVLPDTVHLDLEPGDRILLCTDGLTDMVSDRGIAERLGAPEPPDPVGDRLVEEALAHGGVDNVTIVLIEVSPGA